MWYFTGGQGMEPSSEQLANICAASPSLPLITLRGSCVHSLRLYAANGLLLFARPVMPSRIVSPAFMKTGGLLATRTDAGRRPGRDDVAGFQLHEAARIGDDVGAGEDHPRGRAGLLALSVQVKPEIELLRVTQFVAVTSQGPQGAKVG